MDWLNNLFSGIGNVVKGAAGSIGKGIGTVAQGVGNMVSPLASQMPSMIQGAIKQGATQMPKMFQGAPGGSGQSAVSTPIIPSTGNVFSSIMPTMQNILSTLFPNMKQAQAMPMQTQGASKAISGGPGKFGASALAPWDQYAQNNKPTPPQPQTPAPQQSSAKVGGSPLGFLEGLFTGGTQGNPNVGQTLLGGGLNLLGQFMLSPKVPNINDLPSVSALRNFDITKNTQNLDPAMQKAMEDEMDKLDQNEVRALYQRYANLRPGSSPEEDSNFKKDLTDLQQTQFDRRTNKLAELRFQNASQQMGLNMQEAQELQIVAQMDIDEVMMQFGLDYDKAMQLKEMVSGVGDQFMANGLGAFKPMETASPMEAGNGY